MQLSAQLAALIQPSTEESKIETELKQFMKGSTVLPQGRTLRQQLYTLRDNRKSQLGQLAVEVWKKMETAGWKRVSFQANSAVDSGHSDYDDPSARVWTRGFQSPSGEMIQSSYPTFGSAEDPAFLEAVKQWEAATSGT